MGCVNTIAKFQQEANTCNHLFPCNMRSPMALEFVVRHNDWLASSVDNGRLRRRKKDQKDGGNINRRTFQNNYKNKHVVDIVYIMDVERPLKYDLSPGIASPTGMRGMELM